MVAYWVAAIGTDDPESIKGYGQRAPAAIAKYGGKFLSKVGKFKLLEGVLAGDRVALIEFESMEKAVDCYNSPEYQEALSYREGKADAVFFVVEGTDE